MFSFTVRSLMMSNVKVVNMGLVLKFHIILLGRKYTQEYSCGAIIPLKSISTQMYTSIFKFIFPQAEKLWGYTSALITHK